MRRGEIKKIKKKRRKEKWGKIGQSVLKRHTEEDKEKIGAEIEKKNKREWKIKSSQ